MFSLNGFFNMAHVSGINLREHQMESVMQKLSTGKQINFTSDNVAGLVLSTKLKTQSGANNSGLNNMRDGTSLFQVADNGLQNISSVLNQMNAIAVQAQSGSLSSSDLQNLQNQYSQLSNTIDQIVNSTTFNGMNPLLSSSSSGSSGSPSTNLFSDSLSNGSNWSTVSPSYSFSSNGMTFNTNGAEAITNQSWSIPSSSSMTVQTTFKTGNTIYSSGSAINALLGFQDNSSNDYNVFVTNGGFHISKDVGYSWTDLASNNFSISPNSYYTMSLTVDSSGNLTANLYAGQTATGTPVQTLTVNDKSLGGPFHLELEGATGVTASNVGLKQSTSGSSGGSSSNKTIKIQMGYGASNNQTFSLSNISSSNLGVSSLSVTDPNTISAINNAINTISSERAKYGSYESVLNYQSGKVANENVNLQNDISKIEDVDQAKATSQLAKLQIQQQTHVNLLFQSQTMASNLLKLFK